MGETTDQSQSQFAAEERVERFRKALGPFVVAAETTRMPMVFTDAEGTLNPLVFVNDSFVALTGFARDDVIGKDLLFLLGDVTDRGSLSSIEVALSNGTDGTWNCSAAALMGVNFSRRSTLEPDS